MNWKATKIENKVLKHSSLYMARGWICTLLATSVPASTEKLQLKWRGRGPESQFLDNCEFTGTFDVIPYRLCIEYKMASIFTTFEHFLAPIIAGILSHQCGVGYKDPDRTPDRSRQKENREEISNSTGVVSWNRRATREDRRGWC